MDTLIHYRPSAKSNDLQDARVLCLQRLNEDGIVSQGLCYREVADVGRS